ncbi:hypothetical protein HanIR_Chr02g0093731 [Helianthus annuus]|nr:hypothetical protein HanIR_Chr02g0093731 [Helianthus annuus]
MIPTKSERERQQRGKPTSGNQASVGDDSGRRRQDSRLRRRLTLTTLMGHK